MRKLNACRGVWFVEPFVVGTIFAYQGEIHEEHDAVLRFPVVDNTVFVQGVVEIFVGITLFFWYSDVFF